MVVKVNIEGRFLLIPFGHGRLMVDSSVVEEGFDIKTALGILDTDSVKSYDLKSLSSNPKNSKEQLTVASKLKMLELMDGGGLIKGISGRILDVYNSVLGCNFGATTDSITLRTSCNIGSLSPIVKMLLSVYLSDEYKKNGFDFFTKIGLVRDSIIKQQLDYKLVELMRDLNNKEAKVWASVPEYIDIDYADGFTIGDDAYDSLKFDIDKNDILEKLDLMKTPENVIKRLKRLKVHAISSDLGYVVKSWSAYKCLYAEIYYNGKYCMLIDGMWYEVENNYYNSIEDKFLSLEKCNDIGL